MKMKKKNVNVAQKADIVMALLLDVFVVQRKQSW